MRVNECKQSIQNARIFLQVLREKIVEVFQTKEMENPLRHQFLPFKTVIFFNKLRE